MIIEKKTKWSTIIGVILLLWFASYFIAGSFSDKYLNIGANVAYIPIRGEITLENSNDVPFGQSSISSNTVVDYIEQATKNDNIKAIILEIDSPGGTVVASQEMANAVKAAKAKKPVIAWIRESGASGAYWVASAATVIVASDMSITGSIGVTGSYLQFADLMKNYGVTYERLAAGKYKEAGSPYEKLDPEARKVLQRAIDKVHEKFIDEVANNRKLKREKVVEIADGAIYLGSEAKELGLIDYIGDKNFVLNITKQFADIKDIKFLRFESKKGLFSVLENIQTKAFYYMGVGIGEGVTFKSFSSDFRLRS